MALTLSDVSVEIGGKRLIQSFSLTIAAGEIVTLMGPSGAGKSTLLSFIAGDLEAPFSAVGDVVLEGEPVALLPPERRRIGRLFQDDLLFPHLTVGENLLFGVARGPRPARLAAMRTALHEMGLDGFDNRAPHTLSGGQRARVALMRALLATPRAMLLDEPFNKLDADLKSNLKTLVFAHLRDRRMPCLLVTHDRADAPQGGRVLRLSASGEVRDD